MSNVLRLRPDTPIPLRNNTLALHGARVTVPNYDRAALTPSIVHIGVGGFHRAHQGSYLDDLARSGASMDWGVTGVGLHSRKMKAALEEQDCLYTLVERGNDRSFGRVIGTLRRCLFAPDEHHDVIAALADERTRLVTLTITGDGYHRDTGTGIFEPFHPDVRRDVANVAGAFSTAWAYLVAALAQRRRLNRRPFTVMSCDNVPDNGAATKAALVGFATLRDAELADWIERNVACPSTMVDRITPKCTPNHVATVAEEFGISDRWPVITEPFRQWFVEDAFCAGRPALEQVGVDIVTDVRPYKQVKTRMLNGSHCALSYLGILLGHRTTDTAMADPDVYAFVDQLLGTELAPLLTEPAAMNLSEYRSSVLARLSNVAAPDELSRLAARGSTKVPSYLLPSLRQARSQGRPSALLTLALAAWFRYLRGYDMTGRPIAIEDARVDELRPLALVGVADPRPLLSLRDVFGELAQDRDFAQTMKHMLGDMDRIGIAEVLERTVAAQYRYAG
jgi:mannitol 2-dehydrogenase